MLAEEVIEGGKALDFTAGEPGVGAWPVTEPPHKVLITATDAAAIENVLDKVLLLSVGGDDRAGLRVSASGEEVVVVGEERA